MRKAFNFYKSYYDVAKELPEKDRLAFIWALLEKQFFNKEPDLKGMAKFAYISQEHNILSQVKGYVDKCKYLKINPFDTPTEPPCLPPTEPPTEPPSGQEKEKEKEEEQEKEEVYRKFKHLSISLKEFDSLLELGYSKEQIDFTLDKINNYKQNNKYVSLYLTCKNWLKDEPKKIIKNTKGTIHDNNF